MYTVTIYTKIVSPDDTWHQVYLFMNESNAIEFAHKQMRGLCEAHECLNELPFDEKGFYSNVSTESNVLYEIETEFVPVDKLEEGYCVFSNL